MALEVTAKATGPIPLDVSFRVEPGELMALVGHSGSGKSTILRTIAGLWRPSQARVCVNGTTWLDTEAEVFLPPHARRVGIVFQSYALFPHMTAEANVAVAMDHLPASQRPSEARRLLALVNLAGLERRRPAELSGGQQQRVAVARALARKPQALLLDEPFSAVDRATREALYGEIAALRAHLNMPVILVTHDMDEARLLADRMVVIEHGGMLRAGTAAEIMFDATALHALGIREAGSSIAARIAAQEPDGLTRLDTSTGPLWLPRIEGERGAAVRVRILAHEVLLSLARPEGLSAQNILPATVEHIAPGEGPGALVRLRAGDDIILARVTQRAVESMKLAPGLPCFAVLKSMAVARDQVVAALPAKGSSRD
ncbi:MAG TPA: molybdenum ABC transporter ATP-binding protein [Methylomirabilota bacterium]|nr:molybdenum ABC transporter ATP-binding protein [Methylomirabilota bacterium]